MEENKENDIREKIKMPTPKTHVVIRIRARSIFILYENYHHIRGIHLD